MLLSTSDLPLGVTSEEHYFSAINAHFSFVSSIEPLRVEQALEDAGWLIVMQDELTNFTQNEV